MFMEYCDEGTLESLATTTETGLPEEIVRKYTRQLLEAVHILHERGIVHRDIKGESYFLKSLIIPSATVLVQVVYSIHLEYKWTANAFDKYDYDTIAHKIHKVGISGKWKDGSISF